MAFIPVERVQVSESTFTHRTELVESDVVRVIRYRCDRTRERYHYQADVRRPACTEPEYSGGGEPGLLRVVVDRTLNRKWRPPEFPAGARAVEVS